VNKISGIKLLKINRNLISLYEENSSGRYLHQGHLVNMAIQELVDRILASRSISRTDQNRFMSALLAKNSLSEEDQQQITRVFDGLQMGLIRLVD
jgi:hypothetical protein